MIVEALTNIKAKNDGKLLGISGGASGGDILFHEVCEELNIPSQMYLVLPRNDYVKASVADSGPGWIERFDRTLRQAQSQSAVRFGSFAALVARQERLQYLAAFQSLDAAQCAFYFAGSPDLDCAMERRHGRRSRRYRRHGEPRQRPRRNLYSSRHPQIGRLKPETFPREVGIDKSGLTRPRL